MPKAYMVEYEGKRFESLAALGRARGITRKVMERMVRDGEIKVLDIQAPRTNARAVTVEGKTYDSMQAATRATGKSAFLLKQDPAVTVASAPVNWDTINDQADQDMSGGPSTPAQCRYLWRMIVQQAMKDCLMIDWVHGQRNPVFFYREAWQALNATYFEEVCANAGLEAWQVREATKRLRDQVERGETLPVPFSRAKPTVALLREAQRRIDEAAKRKAERMARHGRTKRARAA